MIKKNHHSPCSWIKYGKESGGKKNLINDFLIEPNIFIFFNSFQRWKKNADRMPDLNHSTARLVAF